MTENQLATSSQTSSQVSSSTSGRKSKGHTRTSAITAARGKRKEKCVFGIVKIHALWNNTFISITKPNGDVLVSFSSGQAGFSGKKKGTPYAAKVAAEMAAERAAKEYGLTQVDLYINGPGIGKESAAKALKNILLICTIRDTTSAPHNGVKARKMPKK